MDWTLIDKITTHPAFIAIVTVGSILGSALLILSKTSFGKKAIAKIVETVSGLKSKIDETHKIVDDTLDKVEEAKKEITNFKEEITKDVKTYFAQLSYFEEGIFNVLTTIPNAKVQEQLEQFYAKWQDKKKEIEEFVGGSFVAFDDKLKELEKQKDNEIANLSNEINELKELINKTLNSLENGENEQRNEGIND